MSLRLLAQRILKVEQFLTFGDEHAAQATSARGAPSKSGFHLLYGAHVSRFVMCRSRVMGGYRASISMTLRKHDFAFRSAVWAAFCFTRFPQCQCLYCPLVSLCVRGGVAD